MSNKKALTAALVPLLGISTILLGCIAFNNTPTSNVTPVSATDTTSEDEEDEYVIDIDALNNATSLEMEDLSVSITKSSETATAKSYSVTFSSQIQTYTNRTRYCYINISDSTFNSDDQVSYEDEEDMPHYTGNVYNITNVRSGDAVYIPRYMKRGDQFFIDVTSINSDVVDSEYISRIGSIYIPIEIESISSEAFMGLNEDVVIYCEVDEQPEGWAEDWTDCENIVWGYEYDSSDETASTYNVYGGGQTYGTGKNFFIGFQNSDTYEPLIMKYDVTDTTTNVTTTEYYIVPISDSRASIPAYDDRLFEGVGTSVSGSTSYSKNIDIELPDTMEIDDSSIEFYNIYEAERDSSSNLYVVNTDVQYMSTVRLGYAVKEHINDYINYTFSLNSSFSGYTSLSLNVDKVDGIYQVIKSSTYESNLSSIEAGSMYVRYRFTNLNSTQYYIVYEYNGELIESYVAIDSPIPRYIIENDTNNNISFLIKNSDVGEGFDGSNIKALSLIGLTISLDLFTTRGSIATKSSTSTRFGILEIFDTTVTGESVAYYDADLILILTSILYTVLYIVVATILFFYLKHKYRNDEFRRMKPKKYLKSAAILWAGIFTCILSIMFIFFRSVPFNNAIVVYNPLDVYVIVFTIVAVFFIGYYIRNLVIAIKANKERKRAIKLRLDETPEDDGTN